MDLSRLSDEDLSAIARGDMASVSDDGLRIISGKEKQEFSFGKMVGNIPSSAGKFISDMTYPIRHPVDTAKGVANLAMGAGEKLIPGEQEHEQYADQMVDLVKQRYGSMDAFQQTVMEDPVGVLADISALVTGVGGGARLATKAGSTANKVAQTVQKAGMAVDPLNLAINPMKATLGAAIPRKSAEKLYESAAKWPPAKVDIRTRGKITNAALDYGIMPTGKGLDKVNEILARLDAKIGPLVDAADSAGITFDRRSIYSELKALRHGLKGGAAEAKNMKKYNSVVRAVDEVMKGGPDALTPSRLQEFKVKTYRDINWKKKPDAGTATMQALAGGARKRLEEASPELAAVNKEYGPLAELRNNLPQVANRIDNHHLLSLNTGIYGGAGGVIGDKAGAAIGAAIGLADNPKIKAGTALKLRELQNAGLVGNMFDNSFRNWLIRQGLFQSGRLNE